MAIYFDEIPESRELSFNPPTAVRHWVCEGEFDDYEVGRLARSTTPRSFLHPLGVIVYRNDAEVKEVGHKVYNIVTRYSRENRELGSYRIEFDTLGGTVNVKGGVHQAVYPSGSPTHDGLIGVKGDDIEGIDIVIPATKIIIHVQHIGDYLTDERVVTLSRLAGAVDNAGFFGWDAYETLFLGAQGSQNTQVSTDGEETSTEVAYHFAISENLVNFSIGSVTGISKKGWDVAWVKWRAAVESSQASNDAEYVNVVRVYKERNLKSILGFG